MRSSGIEASAAPNASRKIARRAGTARVSCWTSMSGTREVERLDARGHVRRRLAATCKTMRSIAKAGSAAPPLTSRSARATASSARARPSGSQ